MGHGGTATVGGGNLTVNGARVDGQAIPSLTAPITLEFRATFTTDASEHVGFGVNLDDNPGDGPWALFSTGSGGGLSMHTRAALGGQELRDSITGLVATAPHTYRIEWSANAVTYYVDGGQVGTYPVTIAAPMRPVASDFTPSDAGSVTLDWLTLGVASGPDMFVSRVLKADDPRTIWGSLSAAGNGVTFKTRTGNTPTPDTTWSDWQSLAGSAIQSPSGQYIQYEATVNSGTSNLDSVTIEYMLDSTPPDVALGDPQVSGTTARVAFSSQATDLARFECSLDAGAFATCSSPTEFAGLAAGSHTVSVKALDKVGNQSSAVSKSFTIPAPAQGGGGGTQPGGSSSTVKPDTVAPKVTLRSTSVRASKRGAVKVKVSCPATETRCTIALQLKRGSSVAARKTVTVPGGRTATVTLHLTKAIRRQLASRHSLKVMAVIVATDAAGNTKTTKRSLTLRAPAA